MPCCEPRYNVTQLLYGDKKSFFKLDVRFSIYDISDTEYAAASKVASKQ